MPRKKTQTATPAVEKPKTFTLTKEQFQVIIDAAIDLMDVRRTLDDLEGQEDISTVMFNVGKAAYIVNKVEDQLDELRDTFEEDCIDCEEDY